MAGRPLLALAPDFGTSRVLAANRFAASASWPLGGFAAVSGNRSSCPASSPTATAFPPRPGPVGVTFRQPSGTTRSSDFSRPVVISSLRPRRLPLPRGNGGREISLGKNVTLRAEPVAFTRGRTAGIGLRQFPVAHPRPHASTALHSRSVRHCTYGFHQTPPRGDALANQRGVPPARVPRGLADSLLLAHQLTSCVTPMPGARVRFAGCAALDPARRPSG